MRSFIQRIWREDDGVLTFEWVLLSSLLAVGVIGGISGTRDAILEEFADVTEAIMALDQSYKIEPPAVFSFANLEPSAASGSRYEDQAHFVDYDRFRQPEQRDLEVDSPYAAEGEL